MKAISRRNALRMLGGGIACAAFSLTGCGESGPKTITPASLIGTNEDQIWFMFGNGEDIERDAYVRCVYRFHDGVVDIVYPGYFLERAHPEPASEGLVEELKALNESGASCEEIFNHFKDIANEALKTADPQETLENDGPYTPTYASFTIMGASVDEVVASVDGTGNNVEEESISFTGGNLELPDGVDEDKWPTYDEDSDEQLPCIGSAETVNFDSIISTTGSFGIYDFALKGFEGVNEKRFLRYFASADEAENATFELDTPDAEGLTIED